MKFIFPFVLFAFVAFSCSGGTVVQNRYIRFESSGDAVIEYNAFEQGGTFCYKSVEEMLKDIPGELLRKIVVVKIEDPSLVFDLSLVDGFSSLKELFVSVSEITGGWRDLEKCSRLTRLELSPLGDGFFDVQLLDSIENITLGKMNYLDVLQKPPATIKSVNGTYVVDAIEAIETMEYVDKLARLYPAVVFMLVPDGVVMDAGE